MTTISKAIANGEDDYEIIGLLVSKRVFMKYSKKDNKMIRLLSLEFVDAQGVRLEFKTWSHMKVFCVYRKARVGLTYIIRGQSQFRSPNLLYSTAKFECFVGWYIEEAPEPLRIKRFAPFFNDLTLAKEALSGSKAASIAGIYLSHSAAYGACYVYGKPLIQGYFVEMTDIYGRNFQVLVWHYKSLDKKFPLFEAKPGDIIYYSAARAAEASKGVYTLTTLYPPAINSPAISGKVKNEMRKTWENNYD